jgi:hypothetical protein
MKTPVLDEVDDTSILNGTARPLSTISILGAAPADNRDASAEYRGAI